MIRVCIFFLVLGFLTSCVNNSETPQGILKPEKMQAVLWDVIRADAFTSEFIKKDSAKNAVAENLRLQQQIFAIHKITKTEFYNSYDYYKKNTLVFKAMLDSMIAKSERNHKNTNIKPIQAD